MAIKDLKPQQGSVNLVLTIRDKGDIREFEKFGKKGRVCSCIAEDESGKISLTLWNDDIDKVGAGDKIEITNGWVGEYRGELQLSTGKFGTLAVLEKSPVPEHTGKEEPEQKPQPPQDDGGEYIHDAESVEDDDNG